MKKNIEISPNIETLFGTRDENLHLLEDGLNVTIDLKADSVEIEGAARDVARAEQVFADYGHLQKSGFVFNNGDLGSMLRVLAADATATLRGLAEAGRQRSFGRRTVQPKSLNQRRYVEAIEKYDMVFGVGPAGTGQRSKRASAWASCRARSRKKWTPTCARCMTRSTTCSILRRWTATWRRT
jgi:phosphate starvation-inducible PhoH-like protein